MMGKMLAISALAPMVLAAQPSPPSAIAYFPPSFATPSVRCGPGSARLLPILSDFENKWYSDQLSAAQEPSLYGAAEDRERPAGTMVRFTWLRSFHSPVVIRVEGLGTTAPRLIAKQLSGAGGYAPGTISKRVERDLSPGEAETIAAEIVRTGVFRLSATECGSGMDGAQWLVEGVDKAGYHFVDRWSPKKGEVRSLGLSMIALTGWQFKDVY